MPKKLVSFWGKGGVGKTTLSSAVAVSLSKMGYRTYLLSSDFVPSLQDVLGVELSREPLELSENLVVDQLFEEKVIEMWKERFGEEVYRVASSIFPVGREIIDYVAGAPGIVEEFTLYYIYELYRNEDFDVLVWDTMATGGGLRMLRIEKEFYDHLGEAVKLYLRVKGVIDRIRTGSEDPLKLIESWRELAQKVIDFLRGSHHVASLVSRSLPVDYYVATRVYRELLEFGIPVKMLFVNMVSGSAEENLYFKKFYDSFGEKLTLLRVPRVDPSPRGIDSLSKLLEKNDVDTILSLLEG